ncbi:MAG TPA: UDP-N-acetylmuramate dehydrogenase [Gemmatimonadales bacterium]|jgi:UDP-N-acetylmuramate dehydrogenase|nr:UDP-N-acetylmuramate dehydrogenase [Gemmatimonadales bacterium]
MARKHARPKPASGRKPSSSHGSRSASGGRVAKGKAQAKPAKAAKPKAAVQAKAPPAPPKVKFHGRMLENEPLSRYTTWRLGGPARYLLQPADLDDVVRGLEMARERGLPWLVLGLGSNVLVKDGGFPGMVIRMGKGLDKFEMKGATAIVGAGMPTPILARRTAEAGFSGVERFIGIPGTVGGGIYMNAGCHGAEFAEIITEVTVMDGKGKTRTIPRKQISYKYRGSNLGEAIVLEAKLQLGEESPAKLKELQAKLFRWRKAGTPFELPCAGSTFKNPGGNKTAGMLIDEVGLKGFRMGGAQVSPLHANYFVNLGNATAADVLRLIDHVRKTVAKKTGVELELEIKVLGN